MFRPVAAWLRRLALPLLLAAPAAGAAPAHLDLEIALDPRQRSLRASAILTTAGAAPDFRLHPRLAITGASVDGRPVAAAELARLPGSPGTPRRYVIEYAGTMPPLPSPQQARDADHAPLYAAPEGSYLAAGAGWYPQPAEPFTYRVTLSLPAGQQGLVPGRQTSARQEGGRWLAGYDFPHPAEGIWLMAGPYQVAEQRTALDDGTAVTVRTWFHPELAELAPGYLRDSARYLQRYSRQIGAYPFGDFSVVSSPLPHGLGMPGLTYLGRAVLRLPFIRATSLGHEVLHNWWGNGVVPDWDGGNWSEGLTTFMADYAFREDQGEGAAREMRLQWLRDLAAVPAGAETALAAFTSRRHGISSVIGYGKSAMVFLMLRDEIGPPAFEQGLRALWRDFRFRSAGWQDLRQAFEQASGRDLSAFFEQWTRRAASPGLSLARVDGAPGRVRVLQAGNPFELLVPLRFVLASGATRDVAVRASARETVVDPAALGVPDAVAVQLDPDLRLWRRLDPASVPPILRDAFIAPRAELHVAGDGPQWTAAATALAQRLLDTQAPQVSLDALQASPDVPALVMGDRAGVRAVLARLRLEGVPPIPVPEARDGTPAAEGTARAWTVRTTAGKTLLFVVADDPAALAALQRAMPHYGRRSWLVFRDDRVVAQGAWPVATPALSLR